MMDKENKFTKYCIIVFSNVTGVTEEIKKISENDIKFTSGAKGIYLATFMSMLKTQELTEFFLDNNRIFILSELNHKTFGANLGKIHKKLFLDDDDDVSDLTNDMLSGMYKDYTKHPLVSNKVNESSDDFELSNIDDMDEEDKIKKINELLDKGVKKLTKKEKAILDKLSGE